MAIYMMIITEVEMEKNNAFSILDIQRKTQKDCLILKKCWRRNK